MEVLNRVDTKYILFGIDDVVFYETVYKEVINKTIDWYIKKSGMA